MVDLVRKTAHTGEDSMPRNPPKHEDRVTDPRPPRSVSFTKDPAYWQALGEFVEIFASAENVLFNYLFLCANIPVISARALLSGLHVDQMIKLIRRVWIVTPEADPRVKLNETLVQFKIINNTRNSMIQNVSF